MTEKKILREALDEIAGWKNAYLFYPSAVVNQLADIAIKALADTEDTGGEDYTWRSCELVAADASDKERTLLTFNVGPFAGLPTIRTCDYWAIPITPVNNRLPPKEQDDEAINKFLKRRGIVGPPLTGLVNDCWNEACKWMISKGEN